MTLHEYSAKDALVLLLRKIKEEDTYLAWQITSLINQGKDIAEERAGRDREDHPATRKLRDEEAIDLILKVLQSKIIELPSCILSIGIELSNSGTNDAQIEMKTETHILNGTQEMFNISDVINDNVDTQKNNFGQLCNLLKF